MKTLMTMMLVMGGLIVSCGAEASSLHGDISAKDRILEAVPVRLQSVDIKKVAVGPAATGVVTEVTVTFPMACYATEEFFAHTTSELADGSLNLYVLAVKSEEVPDFDTLRCLGMYQAKKVIKVPGIYQEEQINLINLEMATVDMPAEYVGVQSVKLDVLESYTSRSGTEISGEATVGCIDKLATVAYASIAGAEIPDPVEVVLAPIVLLNSKTPVVFCFAPNIEKFSFMLFDIYTDLDNITFNYLKEPKQSI